MSDTNFHFDCLKNKISRGLFNENATKYYNRCFWRKCPCEYGTKSHCQSNADRHDPCGKCPNKWTQGCNSCSRYYDRPSQYYYTYNNQHCGKCSGTRWCKCKKCTVCDGSRYCKCKKCRSHCKPCYKKPCYKNTLYQKNKSSKKLIIGKNKCGTCTDVAITFRPCFDEKNCDNVVDLHIPRGGTKEKYMAARFSDDFIFANRYQCATVPVFNCCPENVVDNMHEHEWTESTQKALVARKINNERTARRFIVNKSKCHYIPMDKSGGTSYYKYTAHHSASYRSGLVKEELGLSVNNFNGCGC